MTGGSPVGGHTSTTSGRAASTPLTGASECPSTNDLVPLRIDPHRGIRPAVPGPPAEGCSQPAQHCGGGEGDLQPLMEGTGDERWGRTTCRSPPRRGRDRSGRGRGDRAAGCIGLTPRKAANRVATAGRAATFAAVACGHALGGQAVAQRLGQAGGQARRSSARRRCRWTARTPSSSMSPASPRPRPGPRRDAVHHGGRVGGREHPRPPVR